jgi:ATP-binding cassette subfamily B protein RaxB|nr:peptidase domain-containing ABC transporter [Dyella sp. ASV24]
MSLRLLLSRLRWRQVPVRLQTGMPECGHACLAMIAAFHGKSWSLEELRERFPPPSRGTSVSHLTKMARELGLDTRVFRAEPRHVAEMVLPCVIHWDAMHFVVLEACNNGTYRIVDPLVGRITISSSEFDKRFTGIAIQMAPGAKFLDMHPQKQNALPLLAEGLNGKSSLILSVAVLALVLEVLGLTSPLLIQAVTDSIIPQQDASLLAILVGFFALASLLQLGASLARSSLLIRLGEELTVRWNAIVCSRLLGQPYLFFLQRPIGDIKTRFNSIEEVQRMVTHRFIAGILDGLTATFTLAIIVFYSGRLAALTLGFTVAYGLWRFATLPRLLFATEQRIKAHSAQQSLLNEVLHGVHSIKANGEETAQLCRYSERTRDSAASTRRTQWLAGSIDEVGQAIIRMHWICAVGMAAALVMSGTMTAGMLVAYATYAYQFSLRSAKLLDLASEWPMIVLHGARLTDLVSAPDRNETALQPFDATRSDFRVTGVRFRYGQEDPWILDGVSLNVRDGECIAIKGPSGTGKSTLAKILVGLLDPLEGDIHLGGVALQSLRPADLRAHIACVLQDDQLFSGTIAENIAFFEPGFSLEDAVEAAKLAQIHNEIVAMPLRYQTRVIDLGASLSGGQRQRLILARALYRKPKILVLDEASSHLDLANERRINEAISALKITRIIVAHRPETLAIAARILELRNGALVEVEHQRQNIIELHSEDHARA